MAERQLLCMLVAFTLYNFASRVTSTSAIGAALTPALGATEEERGNTTYNPDEKILENAGQEQVENPYSRSGDVDAAAAAAAAADENSTTAATAAGNTTQTALDDRFPTQGLKNHYEAWIRMIMQSDFVKSNGTVKYNETEDYEENETDETENEVEVVTASSRVRILQKLVYPDHRTLEPEPAKVNRNCECGHSNSPRHKIVGGEETYEHHYPWMVSVQLSKTKKHFCGASIISDSFILTAAHCTDMLLPFELLVRVGDHDLTTNDVSRELSLPVYEIYQHPGYNRVTTDNDISLLRVKMPLTLTWRISPICLTPPDLTFYRESVIVMGWGKEWEKAKLGSPRLRHAYLNILAMGNCRHNFKFHSEEITSNMFCALSDTQDTCQGDSGGPLTWYDEKQKRYFLIGVTSWGIGCGMPNYPGVYTKVAKYLDWIYATTSGSTFCTSYNPQPDRKKIKQKTKTKDNIKHGNQWNNGLVKPPAYFPLPFERIKNTNKKRSRGKFKKKNSRTRNMERQRKRKGKNIKHRSQRKGLAKLAERRSQKKLRKGKLTHRKKQRKHGLRGGNRVHKRKRKTGRRKKQKTCDDDGLKRKRVKKTRKRPRQRKLKISKED
ncbi:uncharacterized protein [Procambarus clarkii]|uniref:uncharacterized protein n=1 Tax=Procambarus clarkii TaxID=6728 RepID=UPI001E6762E4|nr:transmembrane protease serine 11G-like [Procambarus clarkii]